jgi:polysaccharide pyruvyl transferase WcaK-like protein
MPTALLVGAFGQGNPGDEALCAAFRQALPSVRLIVASRDPDTTAAMHRCESVLASPGAVARASRHADCVVVGGGTVFKTLHPSTGRRPAALLRTTAALVAGARVRGARVALIGVGASELPGREARSLARWIVRSTDLLVLRDEESAAVLASAGLPTPFRVGADPAWTLLETTGQRGGRAESVTVALSHLAGGPAFTAALADALAPFATRVQLRLQPWQTGGQSLDARLAEELRDRLGEAAEIVAPPRDLASAAAQFASDRLVIGLRFHALVAAGAARTPFLAIAHEPKLAGLARRLGQSAVPAHAAPAVLARAIEYALDQAPPAAAAVKAETARAEEAFGMLRLLLGGGQLDEATEFAGLPLSTGSGAW